MKKILLTTLLTFGTLSLSATEIEVAVVNFKECVENSKIGKKEQENFEALKKQMESVLEGQEKELNEIAQKLNDPDYLDSISAEAETELKRKARGMQQELAAHQQQFYQALQQANFKVVQDLSEKIGSAAKAVAKKKNIDLVLNDEVTFFATSSLDISKAVIQELDTNFMADAQDPETEQMKQLLQVQ